MYGFIADGNVLCLGIGVRINGDAAYAQSFAGCGHAARNLTAICNQYFVEHNEAWKEEVSLCMGQH